MRLIYFQKFYEEMDDIILFTLLIYIIVDKFKKEKGSGKILK